MRLRTGLVLPTLLLTLAPVWAQIAKPAALSAPATGTKLVHISPAKIVELEDGFDGRLNSLADVNEPTELMGHTRGLQLDGYGLVFTSEVSLVITPSITPFQKAIPKEVQTRVHQRRVERLPILKAAMQEMLRNMAAASSQLPATQQMVLAVRLYYGNWEDTTGMPGQVIMRADRASAAKGNVETEER